jgi:hypothetical protein
MHTRQLVYTMCVIGKIFVRDFLGSPVEWFFRTKTIFCVIFFALLVFSVIIFQKCKKYEEKKTCLLKFLSIL